MWRSGALPIRTDGFLTRAIIIVFLALGTATTGCGSLQDDDSQQSISSIARPYEFSVPKWEFSAIRESMWESLKPRTEADIDDVEEVRTYVASIGMDPETTDQLENTVERILAKQIREALIEEGIVNPLDTFVPLRVVFPPVNVELESPPSLLVVSPRDEIRMLKRRTLEPGLSDDERGTIESQVDALGYSSLVVRLGGVGFTYPTMVVPSRDIRWTLDTAVEEWFHQYLFFHPLGFLYALDGLGWRPDNDIITMNETTAGIVSKEIGAIVYDRYYRQEGEEPPPTREETSEFDLLMREIRQTVDELLSNGQVTESESYMNERRDFLDSQGYHIRKLNQAYFAFHGTYADEPATVSPIGQALQNLRGSSASLREFLSDVKVMNSYEDLKEALEEKGR